MKNKDAALAPLEGSVYSLPVGGTLDERIRPWVPDAKYELAYVDYETRLMFHGQPKLVVRFRILSMGKHFDTVLERWYRVKKLTGKPRRSGGFVVGASSDLFREHARLFRYKTRPDRISFAGLRNRVVVGRTRTVVADHRQRELVGATLYSVIDELIETLG